MAVEFTTTLVFGCHRPQKRTTPGAHRLVIDPTFPPPSPLKGLFLEHVDVNTMISGSAMVQTTRPDRPPGATRFAGGGGRRGGLALGQGGGR